MYYQIADWSYSFFLEAFVAVSGYLYYYQVYEKLRCQPFVPFLKNKLHRLILPSIIFSIVYFAIFYEYKSINDTLYTILNGAGHMWFLPMLFWCYIGGWFLTRLKLKPSVSIIFLLALALLSFAPLPFRLSSAMYYMLFFFMGMSIRRYSYKLDLMKLWQVVFIWLGYIIVFLLSQKVEAYYALSGVDSIIEKLIRFETNTVIKVLYAGLAVIATFVTTRKLTNRVNFKFSNTLVKISSYCFGIYLFQQFILQILYYKTTLPVVVGAYWLPWVGVIVAMMGSILLSDLFLKTKIGRNLIG